MALTFENETLQKLFGTDYSQISTIPVDISNEERVTHNIQLTRKTVEDGTVISDNAIEQPVVINMDCIIKGDLLGDTWLDKKAKIDEIRRAKKRFSIVSVLGVYEEMFFTNIEYVANRQFNTVLKFNATFQQVPTVESETVDIPADASKNPQQQAPAKDKGKVQGEQASPAQNESWLSSLTGVGA